MPVLSIRPVQPEIAETPVCPATVPALAGIRSSATVDPTLCLAPGLAPPCDELLWRIETADGGCPSDPGFVRRYWHRHPFTVTLRLVQYQPGSVAGEIMDEGTIGTRLPLPAFLTAVDGLAMRFVRDVQHGQGRHPSLVLPPRSVRGIAGWAGAATAKWHARTMGEWWSVGMATGGLDRVLFGLGDITWFHPRTGQAYLADPFPLPGSRQILAEEMPMAGGTGRIVSATEVDGQLAVTGTVIEDEDHHSFPCTVRDGGITYCVPETTTLGGTRIFQLDESGALRPVADVCAESRLADPTLFRWDKRYWLACTDLDIGMHDNLCLFHAEAMEGPWHRHPKWPVKIDIRGARSAGSPFVIDGRLYRPAQDCAATYGAAIAIHEVMTLTETDFRELPVRTLRPDLNGPFPHGMHTLTPDGKRFWVDGKRFVFTPGALVTKVAARLSRSAAV